MTHIPFGVDCPRRYSDPPSACVSCNRDAVLGAAKTWADASERSEALRTHKHRIPAPSEVASLADPGAWGDSSDALAHDRLVLGTLVRMENDAAASIEALETYLPSLRDDAYYWQVLLAIWVKNGRTEYAHRYRALFEAPRRNRFRGMKKADRRAWRALPDPVRVYRAVAPGEPPEVFSWTLDPERIRRLYPDREIVERVVPKAQVAFYVDRRREREVIIL